MVKKPGEYRFSSYRSYIGLDEEHKWLRTSYQLGCFSGDEKEKRAKYGRFVEETIGRDAKSPLDAAIGSSILGDNRFVAEIEKQHLEGREIDRDIPDLRKISGRWSPDRIIETVRGVFSEDSSIGRKVSIYLCHRYSGARLKEIGERFGIGASGVSQESRRFAKRMVDDEDLKKIVDGLREKLRDVNV
jgi:hypothetical protein